MLTETGRVVAVENDRVWVETINQSTCGSCAAQKGCGQSLLAKWAARTAYIPVALDGRDPASLPVNSVVTIGIPEDVVVKSSLLLYLLPLVVMVVGAWLGETLFYTETASVGGAFAGLALSGMLVKFLSNRSRQQRRLQPVLLVDIATHGKMCDRNVVDATTASQGGGSSIHGA